MMIITFQKPAFGVPTGC